MMKFNLDGYIGLLAAGAIVLNVGAQVVTKYMGRNGLHEWQDWVSPWIMSAIAMYFFSFLLVAKILSRAPLSLASPLLAGGTFILAAIGGVYFFGESISPLRWLGIVMIVIGILCVSR